MFLLWKINKERKCTCGSFYSLELCAGRSTLNLVIACSACNLSKSDKLANKLFLESVIERNDNLITIPELSKREDMKVYTSKKIQDLYYYSVENGFTDIWLPKKIII
jgi:hypothetical protein